MPKFQLNMSQVQPLVESYPDDVVILDNQFLIKKVNENLAQRLGTSSRRLEGRERFWDTIKIQGDATEALQKANVNESSFQSFITHWSMNNGPFVPCQITILTGWVEEHLVLLIKDLSHEDTLHSKYQAQLQQKDQKIHELNMLVKLLSAARLARDHFELLDRFSRYLSENLGMTAVWLFRSEKFIRRVWLDVKTDPSVTLPTPDIQRMMGDGQQVVLAPAVDGSAWLYVPLLAHGQRLFDLIFLVPASKIPAMNKDLITALSDQISLLMENTELEKISSIDDLTQIRNSRAFRFKLDEYAEQFSELYLALIDVDFFKKVNDNYGHPTGDAVLKVIGEKLQQIEVKNEVVARVGGEEFAVLLPNYSQENAVKTLEKFRSTIATTDIEVEGRTLRVTVSLGLVKLTPNMSVAEFYKLADKGLYAAKSAGRNRLTIVDQTP